MEGNFPNWRSFPIGTIMFSTRMNSTVSWLIMYADNATASHCAVVVKPETILDVTGQGVHYASISDYFDGSSYLVFYEASRDVSAANVEAVCKTYLGQSYGYLKIARLALLLIVGRNVTLAWRIIIDILIVTISLALFCNAFLPDQVNIPAYFTVAYMSILTFNLLVYRPKAKREFMRIRDRR